MLTPAIRTLKRGRRALKPGHRPLRSVTSNPIVEKPDR